ncbi:MAG: DUF1616 domain-containing protein [Methanobacterium sp.]|nr:DUF1616 domain-containing protein [Methanobacterium sp.]
MKQLQNRDIILIILLAVISLTCILISPLNTFPLRIIPCVLILFILPGYSLLTALYPTKENFTFKKRLLVSIILSMVITLLFSLITVYFGFKMPYTSFLSLLVAVTFLVLIIAYRRRKNIDKKEFERYVICEKCHGYYRLKRDEFPEDFEHCQCGGDLKYSESSYIKPEKIEKNLKTSGLGKSSRLKQFKIKSPESEYKDVLLVIILTALSMIAVSSSSLDNSIIRLTLVAVLAFFLPGYSLSVIIFPLSRNINRIKRFFYSIIFSLLIIIPFCSLSLKTEPVVSIMALSIITVSMIMFSFIYRFRSSKELNKVFEDDPGLSYKFDSKKLSKKVFLQEDLLFIFLATILCVIFVTIPKLNETPIRIILGLLFILFLPGYSLIAALFPRKDDLDGIERLALSFGLSIAVTPLIGLLLNYTPFGIRLTPILLSLSIFTVAMITIAFMRRLRIVEEERFSVKFKNHLNRIYKEFNKESGRDRVLSIILVLSIVLAISMTIYVIVTPKQGEKFTEFYILGPKGKASDYPTNLTVGQTGTVNIGIVNHEYAKVDYKLVVKLNNQTINEKNITLSNNGKWENQYNFTATRSGEKQKLEFLLYKLPDKEKVYRSLHLWLNIG